MLEQVLLLPLLLNLNLLLFLDCTIRCMIFLYVFHTPVEKKGEMWEKVISAQCF